MMLSFEKGKVCKGFRTFKNDMVMAIGDGGDTEDNDRVANSNFSRLLVNNPTLMRDTQHLKKRVSHC